MESPKRLLDRPYVKFLRGIIATQRDQAREYRRTISSQKKQINALTKLVDEYYSDYKNHGKM